MPQTFAQLGSFVLTLPPWFKHGTTMWIHLINAYILYRTEVEICIPFRLYKICVLLHGETQKYSFTFLVWTFVHFQNILKRSQISYIPWCMDWMCTDWYICREFAVWQYCASQ